MRRVKKRRGRPLGSKNKDKVGLAIQEQTVKLLCPVMNKIFALDPHTGYGEYIALMSIGMMLARRYGLTAKEWKQTCRELQDKGLAFINDK